MCIIFLSFCEDGFLKRTRHISTYPADTYMYTVIQYQESGGICVA